MGRRRSFVLLFLTVPGLVVVLMYGVFLYQLPTSVRKGDQSDVYIDRKHLDVPFMCPTLESASIQTNLSRLLEILKDPNARQTCAWIRMRVKQMWPKWVKSIYSLSDKQDMSNRKRRKVLLYLGFVSKKANWGFAELQFKGGCLGELVVWSDLIATLYILGHDVTVATEFEEVQRHMDFFSDQSNCSASTPASEKCKGADNIIYTDIVGLKHISKDLPVHYDTYKCRLRIADSFGTEAVYNHKTVSKEKDHVTIWGGWHLRLQQFYTMFPLAPDNTFLGFVVVSNVTGREPVIKENIALVYGKSLDIWKDKESLIKQFHDAGYQIHGTVNIDKFKPMKAALPDFVTNHGVLHGGGFPTLLRRAKVNVLNMRSRFTWEFPRESDLQEECHEYRLAPIRCPSIPVCRRHILGRSSCPNRCLQMTFYGPSRSAMLFIGLGMPLEGPAALEAIASGAVFINPKIKPPLNYKTENKPTEREVYSQNPYIEQFIGEPYSYTVDITDNASVEDVIEKINEANKFEPFLTYEYSEEGYIQRINSYVEHQDFCQYEKQFWPPDVAVKILLAEDGVSCKEGCWTNNRICEPSHFFRVNSTTAFKTYGVECNQTELHSDIFYPAVQTNIGTCVLQNDSYLFSCVGGKHGLRRMCPCRTYIKFQSALSKPKT